LVLYARIVKSKAAASKKAFILCHYSAYDGHTK
jgi:hypothetical protein